MLELLNHSKGHNGLFQWWSDTKRQEKSKTVSISRNLNDVSIHDPFSTLFTNEVLE